MANESDEGIDSFGSISAADVPGRLAEAAGHHQAGRLSEAERLYRLVLTVVPAHAGCLHLLGVVAYQTGRHNLAVEMIGRAIAVTPASASYHSHLGLALAEIGRFDEAIASHRRAVDLNPRDPEAHSNLGLALHRQGRAETATACFGRALELQPDHVAALSNLGNALNDLGRLEEAVACHRRVVGLRPGDPAAHNNLGVALAGMESVDAAAACFRRAVMLQPNYADAHANLGNALHRLERTAEAAASYCQVLRLKPDHPEAHNNLGKALCDLGRLDEAELHFRQALAYQADHAEALNNLGVVLQHLERSDQAREHFRRALTLKPDYAEAWSNLGNVAQRQGDLDQAITCHRRAVELRPDNADAHNNLALALLAHGELAAGWVDYEWRWQTPAMVKDRRGFPAPQWQGEAAAGQTLLVHAEQGFGDTIQFCRLVPLAAACGLRVILEVQRPLVRLLRGLPGAERVIGRREHLPPFDLHCPLLSLPLALGTTLTTIPAAAPLTVDAGQTAAWRSRLATQGERHPRVGLAWAGNPAPNSPNMAAVDRRRSLPPERLAPLFDLPGPRFFSLQMGGSTAPAALPLTDFMAEMSDFSDTAALVANLDLVISVDTAIAHLAATMGKPVWLLDRFDPCWRWLRDRDDSPWYPTLRLFRQPRPGDWTAVIEQVKSELG